MKFITKTGFTLIELLVVITIIGILATGATTVYTSQIQKARDTVRISDIKALQSGIEQFYQDSSVYPVGEQFGPTGIQVYVPKLPLDPKSEQNCNNNGGSDLVACDYRYFVGPDANTILDGSYEISTAFENAGNVQNKAEGDGGLDDLRLEFGLDLETNNTTQVPYTATLTELSYDDNPSSPTRSIIIAGGAFNTP